MGLYRRRRRWADNALRWYVVIAALTLVFCAGTILGLLLVQAGIAG